MGATAGGGMVAAARSVQIPSSVDVETDHEKDDGE